MKKFYFFVLFLLIFGAFVAFFKNNENSNKYDFILKSEFSEQTSLKDFTGKRLIVYFGYTFCPDVCPLTLSLLANQLEKLKNDKAFVLFISLDLKRDKNIKELNEYVRYFYPNSTALLAENEKILHNITQNYGVIFKEISLKDSVMEYSIAHSNKLYLIDERGNFVKELNNLVSNELFKELKQFLNE